MAPWGSRLIPSNSPETLNPPTSSSRSLSPLRAPGPSQVTESDILQHAYGIPTLQASPGERTSRHGRSRSHPFPSLFQNKKKRQEEVHTAGSDMTDDENPVPYPSQTTARAEEGRRSRIPDKDLMTGRCMTCDSMVRWPKELSVFRCTVCLTINDLKPIGREVRHANGRRKQGDPTSQPVAPVQKPISLEKTVSLIEQCITSYLTHRFEHPEVEFTSSGYSPPPSPRESNESIDIKSSSTGVNHRQSQNLPFRPGTQAAIVGRGKTVLVAEAGRDSEDSTMPYSRSTPGSYEHHSTGRGPATSMHRPSPDMFAPYSEEQDRVQGTSTQKSIKSSGTTRTIFRPLEDYIIAAFTSYECINTSFSMVRPGLTARAASENTRQGASASVVSEGESQINDLLSNMDAKTLLVGDFAENGLWWTGVRDPAKAPSRSRSHRNEASGDGSSNARDLVNVKSPKIDWTEVSDWYRLVISAGNDWRRHLNTFMKDHDASTDPHHLSVQELGEMEEQILEAQAHTQRVLLKATETLLKRPGGRLKHPEDIRFLLIILANPLLYQSPNSSLDRHATNRSRSRSRSRNRRPLNVQNLDVSTQHSISTSSKVSQEINSGPGQHSGIIKRILGLLSNLSNECHHHLVGWFARFSESHFKRITELIGGFVTYRLTRQHGRKRGNTLDLSGGLIPSVAASGGSSAAFHAALGSAGQASKQSDNKTKSVVYDDDWQIKAAARVMALLFSANNSGITRRHELKASASRETSRNVDFAARERAHRHGQILATSDFYSTLLDYADLVADFEAWESKRGRFSFCQYPFFLSIWAKIQIMEYDARRQMEVKAREAFFDSIMSRKAVNQYLVLKIRRECLVEDSLKGVSEVVGTGSEEIKKGLRIEFKGEEGIDAGGLRKEWFLLLVRDVFNPDHGMFTYDEDSRVCYFNPNTFETSDQFFLVGVVLGLAIYNSTILDVALPPFAFRKLLAAGPTAASGAPSHAKPTMTYSLDDLAEYRPGLAGGLKQLLEYEGDVEGTFCRDFVADVERYGQIVQIPLCPNGEKRAVTNANRREFVDLYVRYLLDTAVTRQFEPFKRGFFTVCGGNALSLFRPEEIELLIRGSDEPLDISSLQAVSLCENWGVPNAADTEPVISWFWQSFRNANPKDQRKLLSFITGSDRIPAMGAANLVIKLSCLGEDCNRFPVARTCFNMLSLYRYESRIKLESMLWRAVNESEGFGLK